jgi:hypothetical protein
MMSAFPGLLKRLPDSAINSQILQADLRQGAGQHFFRFELLAVGDDTALAMIFGLMRIMSERSEGLKLLG